MVVPGEYGTHIVAGNLGIVQDEATGTIWLPFNRGNKEAWMSSDDKAKHGINLELQNVIS